MAQEADHEHRNRQACSCVAAFGPSVPVSRIAVDKLAAPGVASAQVP